MCKYGVCVHSTYAHVDVSGQLCRVSFLIPLWKNADVLQQRCDIKNNDFMKFIGKWMELENIILSEVTQSQKNTHGMYLLRSGY